MSSIIEINQLREKDGIYTLTDVQPDFGYSDGQDSEHYLAEVFSKVNDLSSASAELQQHITDWPSEYHFTHKRANLLRGLNLSACTKVLELGSGCGAISRYLGEQGLTVDAIEGSEVRAKLGRERCRDLPNVRVINANYNDLQIPQGEYNLVLFVGVIEYASKFYPEAPNDYAAAQQILSQARSWLAPEGVVLVAIENRLGLKYILGQHEDHYHKRYIGIDGYRQSAGMATYSRVQWDDLKRDAGFSHLHCLLPFPDYKVPDVVLSEEYVNLNVYAYNHLEGVFARDYSSLTERQVTEPIALQAATQGGFLPDLANSFCMLLGENQRAIATMANLDFYHGPVISRKKQYAVETIKPYGSDIVSKRHVFLEGDKAQDNGVIKQDITAQAFIKGDLLSTRWLRSILIYNDLQSFSHHLQIYYQYLHQLAQNGSLAIDVLPNNVIVDANDDWHVFDQEWQLSDTITADFVYFRALLNFITRNWYLIREFLANYQFNTVKDLILHGFAINGVILDDHLQEWIEQEQYFQSLIGHKSDVESLVMQSLEHKRNTSAKATIRLRSDNDFIELCELYRPQQEASTLRFVVPASSMQLTSIEFFPYDVNHAGDLGFFHIEQIKLIKHRHQEDQQIWSIGSDLLAEQAKTENLIYNKTQKFWSAQTAYPMLRLELTEQINLSPDMQYYVEVVLAHNYSDYYSAARSQFIALNKTLQDDNARLRAQVKDETHMRKEAQELKAFFQQEVLVRDEIIEKFRNHFAVRVMRKVRKIFGLK